MSDLDEPMLSPAPPGERSGASRGTPLDEGPELVERIGELLRDQPYGVLCTHGEEQGYGSLVAFAVSPGLDRIVFATPSTTRKYKLLVECPRVAMLVDDRSRYPDERFMEVQAVTATGRATEVARGGPAFEATAGLLIARHAYLDDMVRASTTAVVQIEVARYFHVTGFQTVRQWEPPRDT